MQKLTKQELQTLAEVAPKLRDVFDEIEVERELFEGKRQRLIEAAAELKEQARALMDDAAMVAEEYHGDKSERWQQSERGEAYAEWANRLREIADAIGEEIEAPEIEPIDLPAWVSEIEEAEFAEFEG